MSAPDYPVLKLKNKEERRLKQGHNWVFSNEIDTKQTPLNQFEPGRPAILESAQGQNLGVVHVNPNSLIAARLLTRKRERIGEKFLETRISAALALRERLFPDPFYRLIYGDSDGLSGLVVDRFDQILVVQLNTVGMDMLKPRIVDALTKVLQPQAILFKNESSGRKQEGLPSEVEVAFGEVPDYAPVIENGVTMLAPVMAGQKTGWFYDHRPGRAKLQQVAQGQKVLDVFSYVGGWGLQALAAGADSVTLVDASGLALDVAEEAAKMQGREAALTTLQGDAFKGLEQLLSEGEKYDVIVVDPPAFVKRKKDFAKGKQAYKRINELAMRALNPDGILFSGSCSMHLQRNDLMDVVRGAGRQVDRFVQVFDYCGAGADHPIHPAMPETEYLKTLIARVGRA